MLCVLTYRVVPCGFNPWTSQTKDYKIGKCCFSAKLQGLRSKTGQDNVLYWNDMSCLWTVALTSSSILSTTASSMMDYTLMIRHYSQNLIKIRTPRLLPTYTPQREKVGGVSEEILIRLLLSSNFRVRFSYSYS